MTEDDVFAASRRTREDWDDLEYRTQQLAGALLETVCPRCEMRIGALVINRENDDTRQELECPACRHRFEEDV